MKRIFFLAPLFFTFCALQAQKKPKLVVGIIVDQMRQEYLYRFNDKFSEDGFKRMINDGYMFKNAHYNYVPTYTAPGHTSVYTGSTPAIHGIIGNDFYDKAIKKEIYCASDTTVKTVGSSSQNGEMSPRRMLTTTITDELRLSDQMRSKVVGISIKDRAAIMPAGHTGEAYWFDKSNGNFITSTYYMDDLPGWVKDFNKKKRADYFLGQTWEPLYKLDTYTESISDANNYEEAPMKDTPVFPYSLKKGEYWMVPETPFGNDIVAEMSLQAIESAGLGTDDYTDFLAISFSSTDYIGHSFGPQSKEVEDTYLRLDKNIAQIINALDEKLGKGNYTMFLTADHAVADVPQYLIDNKVPAGYFDKRQAAGLVEAINKKFGEGQWIENVSNNQIFLDRKTIAEKGVKINEVEDFIAAYLVPLEGIAKCYPAYLINSLDYNTGGTKGFLVRGYNQKRSGDVMVVYEPGWMSHEKTGSTHGTSYTYDTNVPVLWYGWHVPHGESVKYHPITDVAPTISMMLDIKLPNGATGQPLGELFEN